MTKKMLLKKMLIKIAKKKKAKMKIYHSDTCFRVSAFSCVAEVLHLVQSRPQCCGRRWHPCWPLRPAESEESSGSTSSSPLTNPWASTPLPPGRSESGSDGPLPVWACREQSERQKELKLTSLSLCPQSLTFSSSHRSSFSFSAPSFILSSSNRISNMIPFCRNDKQQQQMTGWSMC